ncbi:hypothetical protein GN316_11945 [Xylophilus sp. Kf1]|nr:hypothetical protein [Xylophilus sp. Kf1]
MANNDKVLDACMVSGGDCSGAITRAQQDRRDLQAYREALVAQQGETQDTEAKRSIEAQIKQADAQIRSADTAISDGKIIQAGGNYTAANLTDEERQAIGFALDPLGAAGIKGGVKAASDLRNAADNAIFAEKLGAAVNKGTDRGVSPTLLNELTANGVKFTPENVIATARSPSGQVVFLETGDSYSGLTHIA